MKRMCLALIACLMLTSVALQAQVLTHTEVNVGDFTALNVGNSINVIYCANKEKAGVAEFDVPVGKVNPFIFKNNEGKLSLQLYDYSLSKGIPTVRLYSSMLQEVVNQSDSTIIIENNESLPTFSAKTYNNGTIKIYGLNTTTTMLRETTGKGFIYVEGTTTTLKCSIVGTGSIDALRLKATDISCSLRGTGHVYCQSAGGKLNIKGMGSGKVHYTGTPSKISVKKLGSLKAIPYNP
ncbi:MAG: GIN domain-containing protein [Sodaliphilus sp.]